MIHLTSLLFEQTKKSDDVVLENPNVLFIGDTYTRSRSSYANKLLDTKSVRGKIVSWPDINLKQMAKLIARYSNSDKFDIVSILFGDSITKHTDLKKLKKQLDAVINSADVNINTIVVVQNPKQQYTAFSGALDLIDGLNVDAIISSGNDLASPDTQSTIANNWLSDVKALGYNLELKINKKDANATSDDTESPDNQINTNSSDSYETPTVIPNSLIQVDGTINIVPAIIPADSDGSNNTITPDSAETIDQQNAIQKLELIVPVPGRRGYGPHKHPKNGIRQMHWGIDFANAGEGTPVIALKPGVCILSQPSSTAGEYVKIKHEDGAITTYMHFTKRLVKVNDEIKIGTVVGLVGNTGLSFGAHLHWEYTAPGDKSPTDGAAVITNYFAFAKKSILNSKPV